MSRLLLIIVLIFLLNYKDIKNAPFKDKIAFGCIVLINVTIGGLYYLEIIPSLTKIILNY